MFPDGNARVGVGGGAENPNHLKTHTVDINMALLFDLI